MALIIATVKILEQLKCPLGNEWVKTVVGSGGMAQVKTSDYCPSITLGEAKISVLEYDL